MNTDKTATLRRGLIALVFVTATGVVQPATAQDDRDTQIEYVVRPGDTLYSIARRFNITVDALRRTNRLAGDYIQIGQTLTIRGATEATDAAHEEVSKDTLVTPPVGPVPTPAVVPQDRLDVLEADSADAIPRAPHADSIGVETRTGFLVVRPAQSLYDVAFATGLAVDSLVALNPSVGTFFTDSTRLVVPAEYATVRYSVKRGDTLFKIAGEAGSTVPAIRLANGLSGDVIHVGQVLEVPSTRFGASPQTAAALPVVGQGEARVYPDRFAGRLTASGRPYQPEEFSVSHGDLPIGSVVLITSRKTKRQTFAEVTDRLPGSASYLIDISAAVMLALGLDGESNLEVELRVVRFGKHGN